MWETTFPLHSHTGLGRPVYERNILTSMKHFRKMAYPIRRGYGAEMLFPIWEEFNAVGAALGCVNMKPQVKSNEPIESEVE